MSEQQATPETQIVEITAEQYSKMMEARARLAEEAKVRVERAISLLTLEIPLYATTLMYASKTPDWNCPTMGVGFSNRTELLLLFNPQFVMGLTRIELDATLIHEALHILLHHITRSISGGYNMKEYNIAADIVNNQSIKGLPPKAIYPENFDFPRGESTEAYYSALKKKTKKFEDGSWGIPMNGQGKYDPNGEGKLEIFDDHSHWGEAESDIIDAKVRAIAEKAIKAQENRKSWGNIPGDLVQAILAANRPKVNWKAAVKNFVNRSIQIDKTSTRSKPNRRTGLLFPGVKKDHRSKLMIGLDTSGSVSDHQLQEFLQEICGLCSEAETWVQQFDHQLQGECTLIEKHGKKFEVRGRGGTSFSPVIFKAVEEGFDGLIMFTDGYAEFPPINKLRGLKILWCVCKQDEAMTFPYGKKVVIPESKK